jgi:DNA-binding NarL/FixJ family response regulator
MSATTNGALAHARENGGVEDVATDRVRVVIADADPLARRVVRDALQENGVFAVAAEATDGVEAVELALHYRPDILLAEVNLPRIDGIEATRRILGKAPEVRVVIFSTSTNGGAELKALRAGASGYISKDVGTDSVLQAIHAVMRGEAAVSRTTTMQLVETMRKVPESAAGMRPVVSNLTTREWEVLDQMSRGHTTREIADELFLTEDTVYSHVKNVLRKLGVHSREEAVVAAESLRQPV